MFPALWIAKTGLDAQQTNMSVISNNLANVNTTAFKRDRAVFQDLMYQNVRQVGAQSTENTTLPSGLALGTGVRTVATQKYHSQGNITQTSNPLDIAIQGKGYFQILHPDGGIAYSRDGTFSMSADGEMVTPNGYLLQPAITIPDNATSVTIGSDGVVSALLAGASTPTQLGQVELANFTNPEGLAAAGGNLYRESAASGSPQTATPGSDSLGTLLQGALESSNVNVVEELVSMIETQRAYEMNSKAISAADDMLSFVTNQL
ncbi:MAG: flagellar basal-body rod protein FlgG [Candidatus Polarisedimenticolaceae bacterium]|nr:flagellar basal-body rod protein FlgG [Candidatus Polarisedimenticolaceae bacterium]